VTVPEQTPVTESSHGRDAWLFARNFLRHPRMLGSIIPSSRFLTRQLLAPVNWGRARVLVEYGPGVGNITREVLRHMRPDARLVAIEMNADFVSHLNSTISDPRLQVVAGSAADVDLILRRLGLNRADYIIAGIPFSTLAPADRAKILRKTVAALAPGGAFLLYQFSGRILQELKGAFGYVGRQFQPLNVLPAHLFTCQLTAD
jgi:phospholipid N-methyltransferase